MRVRKGNKSDQEEEIIIILLIPVYNAFERGHLFPEPVGVGFHRQPAAGDCVHCASQSSFCSVPCWPWTGIDVRLQLQFSSVQLEKLLSLFEFYSALSIIVAYWLSDSSLNSWPKKTTLAEQAPIRLFPLIFQFKNSILSFVQSSVITS